MFIASLDGSIRIWDSAEYTVLTNTMFPAYSTSGMYFYRLFVNLYLAISISL